AVRWCERARIGGFRLPECAAVQGSERAARATVTIHSAAACSRRLSPRNRPDAERAILDFAAAPGDNFAVIDRRTPPSSVRRLVVPLVLAVAVIGTVAAVATTSTGCGDDAKPRDAGVDAPIDGPIV